MPQEIISSTGNVWIINDFDVQYEKYSPVLSSLLAHRGISEENAFDFLNPTFKKFMPDPYVLHDMERGVERIYSAIKNNEPFAVIGDYDVDGITSTALMHNYLTEIGFCNFKTYLPHRTDDGYGLNKNIITRFDTKLIVALDNGSTAYDAINFAHENGKELVIIDHHTMAIKPDVLALINPHRPDEPTEQLKGICSVGLAFLFIVALNRKLKQCNFFNQAPDLKKYLDIVALGTVCDAMPLIGLNRVFVNYGIKSIHNLGILALLDILNINVDSVNEETLGYMLGPRLNAPGRLSSANKSLDLLICSDSEEAARIAAELDQWNHRRQTIEAMILDRVKVDDSKNFLCVYDDNWHVGVIGIIAGRLKERYNLPTFAISFDEEGMGHGSARSVAGVDLAAIIRQARGEGILTDGGGHKLAAGFSLHKQDIERFINFLDNAITFGAQAKRIICDGYISIPMISLKFVQDILKMSPFGGLNESPKFVLSEVMIAFRTVVGKNQKHISITLEDELGNTVRGISFNSVDSKLGQILLSNELQKSHISVVCTLSVNKWNGNSQVSANILDVLV